MYVDQNDSTLIRYVRVGKVSAFVLSGFKVFLQQGNRRAKAYQ